MSEDKDPAAKMSIAEIEQHMARGETVQLDTDGGARIVDPKDRVAQIDALYREVATERNALKRELESLRRSFQWPYIEVTKINDLQMDTIKHIIPRLKQAHFTNLRIRINGEWEEVECDWLKHLVLPS